MLRALSLPCCGLTVRLCECNPIPSRRLPTVDHRGDCDAKPPVGTNAGRGSGRTSSVNGLELGDTIPGASHRSGNATGCVTPHRFPASSRTLAPRGQAGKDSLNNDNQLNSFNHGESV